MTEAGTLLLDSSGPKDPMFQHLLPAIASELGCSERLTEDDIDQELWSQLREAPFWTQKGDKVALNKWFGVLDAYTKFDEQWHSRFLFQLFLGMHLGQVSRTEMAVVAQRLEKVKAKREEEAKAPVAQPSSELAALRSACSNQLHLALHVLGI